MTQPDLALEPFWKPLNKVIDWAYDNVTSTLCSCLATHAVLQFRYGKKRRHLGFKRWGVYSHRVVDRTHPLVSDVNTRFDVPHSRFNQIDREQFEAAGLHILVESDEAGVHLAASADRFRIIFFQGHPEYDTISLFKEYKREVSRFVKGERADYPPFPENYFSLITEAILDEHRDLVAGGPGQGRGDSRAAGVHHRAGPGQHLARHRRGRDRQLDRQGLPGHQQRPQETVSGRR